MTTSVRWGVFSRRAAGSFSAAVAFWHYGLPMEPSDLHDIAGVAAGVAGTLLGFLITAVALLTSVMDRTLIANMRKVGSYQFLVVETFQTCIMLTCVLVVSVVSMFLNVCAIQVAFAVLSFFACLTLIYLLEAGQRFFNVIKALS